MKRIAILQSNYIPWKGYFDLISQVDIFVIYDSVQYTKNDWRNRNKLLGPNGPIWLTIPIRTSGRASQRISEAVVTDGRWSRKHWLTIEQCLKKAAFFDLYKDEWATWYEFSSKLDHLHEINRFFLAGIIQQLGIKTVIKAEKDIRQSADNTLTATERLIALCLEVGATTYLTGPAGLDYLDVPAFREVGVEVKVIDYSKYESYPQLGKDFSHFVSVLDLLANVGPSARHHLLGLSRTINEL